MNRYQQVMHLNMQRAFDKHIPCQITSLVLYHHCTLCQVDDGLTQLVRNRRGIILLMVPYESQYKEKYKYNTMYSAQYSTRHRWGTCDQQAIGGIWPQSPVWAGTVHPLLAAGA